MHNIIIYLFVWILYSSSRSTMAYDSYSSTSS